MRVKAGEYSEMMQTRISELARRHKLGVATKRLLISTINLAYATGCRDEGRSPLQDASPDVIRKLISREWYMIYPSLRHAFWAWGPDGARLHLEVLP